MIIIQDKKYCCGCSVCVQVCPQKCIRMRADEEGFLYPYVNESVCIDCGLCERVCPVINQHSIPIKTNILYAIKHNEDNIRKDSSSGGFFSALADYVLENNGIVYGAAFNADWKVNHIRVIDSLGLSRLRGAKYVQSMIDAQTYKQCQEDLMNGYIVLFSGTSCQISALNNYLNKKFDNLITVEVVCHGVPSPLIFNKYIYTKLPVNAVINDISFRNKDEGWKLYYFQIKYSLGSNNFILKERVTECLFMQAFIQNLILRPSCYNCPAKKFKSGADMTIADFWGQEITFPEFDDDRGVSAVFANSKKAIDIINSLKDCTMMERQYDEFIKYNPSLCESVLLIKKQRSRFWRTYLQTNNFSYAMTAALRISFLDRIWHRLKMIIK